MPPAIDGYNDDIEEYPYDLEKAKELLQKLVMQMDLKWNYGQCLYHVHICQMARKLLKLFNKL